MGAVHLAHSAFAHLGHDVIHAKRSAGHRCGRDCIPVHPLMRSPAGRSVLPRSTSSSKCGGTAHRGGSAAGILTPSILACTPGTGLGPYEIVASLGAGAMGEVHRARDTRLNRDVAIKSLSGAVARDPDRRERFEREEQT